MQPEANRSCAGAEVDWYFRRRGFLERVHACMLAPLWSDLIGTMRKWGYAEGSIYTTLRHALRFAEFAAREGIHDPTCLSDGLVPRYLETLRANPRVMREVRNSLRHLITWLRDSGVIPPAPEPPIVRDAPLVEEYAAFLENHRSIKARTIRVHREHVLAFLDALGHPEEHQEIAALEAPQLFRFVTTRAKELSRPKRKSMCAALRCFLRFLHVMGHVSRDLVDAVPVIPSFKLDRLPRPITQQHVERVIRTADRKTPIGRRDYAILLILGTYGIRAGQLTALRLEDIDWRQETIRIRGAKGGHDVCLPLLPQIGRAIVDYLRHGRPAGPFREVLLRARPPFGPLLYVFNVVRKHVGKAGLTDVPVGPHAWRHGLAGRLLANGNSLKLIGDVLGHRSIESTLIYTKIDIEMLRQAALEWPGASA